MNDLVLYTLIRQHALELEHKAQLQRLAQDWADSSQTHGLERLYYSVKFLFWFAASLPVALLVLLVQSRGFTLGQIGFLLGVFALTVALLEVPSGMLADLFGRKRTALVAYLFLVAAQLALFFAFSLPLFALWAVLYGVGRALVSGALEAWFVDRVDEVAPGTDMQPLFAKAGTVELLALTLGTLAGGVFPKLFGGLPEGGMLSPLSVVLLISAGIYGVLFLVVALGLEDNKTPEVTHGNLRALVGSAVTLSRQSPALRLLFAGAIAGGFAGAGLETFWQPQFAQFLGTEFLNTKTMILSVIMAGSFGVGMLGNLASIPISRLCRGHHGRTVVLAQGLGGLAFVLLALQTQALPAVLLFWLVYLTLGVSSSPLQTLLNEAVPSSSRAAMLSVGSLMSYIGYFLGSLLLGQVAERLSIAAAWGVAGAVLFTSLLFYLRLSRLERAKPVSTSRVSAPL